MELGDRVLVLEEARKGFDKRLRDHSGEIEKISEDFDTRLKTLEKHQANLDGAIRVLKLMWGILCALIMLDLSFQGFAYHQFTETAKNQALETQSLKDDLRYTIQLLQGDHRGQQDPSHRRGE